MADTPRIDELRRRVQNDPASIAFAHLAEEHRRAGDHHEAVRVCRAGLEQYPETRTAFEYVLGAAPDNLVAIKSMTELQERAGADLAPHGAGAVGTPLKVRPRRDAPSGASPPQAVGASPPEAVDPALEELQGWLAGIQAERAERVRFGGSATQAGAPNAHASTSPRKRARRGPRAWAVGWEDPPY